MPDRKNRVCPVEIADGLDNKFRRLIQNPRKMLKPYIKAGMTILDLGCGPGFFTIDMARMAGSSGRVIAADLQEGMLRKVEAKIKGTELENRITLHQCEADKIGVTGEVDFVLLIYMVHEVPDIDALFKEIASILKPQGQVLLIEPPFHVSKTEFEDTLTKARKAGLRAVNQPKMFLNKAAVLEKG